MTINHSAGLDHFDGASLVKHIDTLFDRIFGLDRPLPILLMEISAKAIALDFPEARFRIHAIDKIIDAACCYKQSLIDQGKFHGAQIPSTRSMPEALRHDASLVSNDDAGLRPHLRPLLNRILEQIQKGVF